jgi:hypothetical protein
LYLLAARRRAAPGHGERRASSPKQVYDEQPLEWLRVESRGGKKVDDGSYL